MFHQQGPAITALVTNLSLSFTYSAYGMKRRPIAKKLKANAHQDAIVVENDFGLFHHQEAGLNAIGLAIARPPSPQKLLTAWTVGDSWLEDNVNFALDDSSNLYEHELNKEGWEVVHEAVVGKHKRKRKRNPRSELSVSSVFYLLVTYSVNTILM